MRNCAELADYEWLTSPAASVLLRDLANGNEPLHTVANRLRRDHAAARVHLLLEQIDLRHRAAAKFSRADAMFFTPLGLEQATDQWVAAYKARRFAGRGPVADLCCGVGGDLLSLSAVAPVIGVDRDPVATCFAAANIRALEGIASVRTCDIAQFDVQSFASWHIDPDRRPAGKRTTALEWSSPSRDAVDDLLTAVPHAAVKLAPAAEVPDAWTQRCELEWISRDRECRQLVAWHGELAADPGQRRATVLSKDGNCERSIVGEPGQAVPFVKLLDRYLFEPDAAVLASHLTGVLAAEHGLSAFTAGVAYFTGPTAIDDPALACFEIDEVLPLEPRRLAQHLRARHIGRLEIKKRGVEHDPESLRIQLRLVGDEAATLILTKLNCKHVAVVARRTENPRSTCSPAPDSRLPAPPHATCL